MDSQRHLCLPGDVKNKETAGEPSWVAIVRFRVDQAFS